MATLIPFKPSIGRYRFITVIDGTQYIFKVRWNTLDAAWYFDVLEFDETPVVEGVKIVLGANYARWSNHPLFLNGNMFARSKAQIHKDPGFDDLGVTVFVYYMTRAELVQNSIASITPAD